MSYDPAIEATDPVTVVHEQMAYWRKKGWTNAQMVSAVTGWNVHYASVEATFDLLSIAWQSTLNRRGVDYSEAA